MTDTARVAVIGGGIVGASVLYHLARAGWTDAVLLERAELASGSTWHAAGNTPHFNTSLNLSRIHLASTELYQRLEAETGQAIGFHRPGSLRLASVPDRMDEYRRHRGKARTIGLPFEVVGPEEIRRLHPLVDTRGLLGAAWNPEDGHVDPTSVTRALVKGASDRGARVHRHTRVTGLERTVARRVADRHRPGNVPDRGRRQRRRHVGARGRAAGRTRPADRPDGAPVPRDRGDPGDRGARRRAPAPAGGRRFLLPPTGSPRTAARPLRARGEAVRGRGHPAGLRRRPPAARRRAPPGHRRGCDGARPRARPGRRRSDRQRSDYLHAGREPARRAGVRAARLLARLRGELRDHASGWCGPVPGRVDRGGAAVDRSLGGGSATLRRLRHRAPRGRPVRRHLRGRVRDRLSAGRPPPGPAGPDEPALRAFPGGRRGLRRPERVGAALLVRARGGGAVRPAELPPDELVRRRRPGGARRPRAGGSARALELLQVRGARPGRGALPGSTVREPAPTARPDRALAAPHAARCDRVRRHRDAARARAIPRGERRGRRAPRSRLAAAPCADGWERGHRGRHGEVGRADSGRAREPGRFLLA